MPRESVSSVVVLSNPPEQMRETQLLGTIVESVRSALAAPAKSTDPSRLFGDIEHILACVNSADFADVAELLVRSSFLFFEIGHSQTGIAIGLKIAERAKEFRNQRVQRQIYNILGGQCGDIADFPSALRYLELAVGLARGMRDSLAEASCLANVVAVLQEMGHYKQAISIARRVLKTEADSEIAINLQIQCASNGLFAAHRIGDATVTEFIQAGERCLGVLKDPLRRAFFERSRAIYLVDKGQSEIAIAHLESARRFIGKTTTPRIVVLMELASALCDWGRGSKDVARAKLLGLYNESAQTRLYHHFILQALVKVHSDAESQQVVEAGLRYARELVEFTTSVKKAKFYRQLQARRQAPVADSGHADPVSQTNIEAFASQEDWLSSTQIQGLGHTEANDAKRHLTKHEELTAIHDDMARLRVAGLRREIRTDAVDTAENWAIAAEFFDDETGKHCYRVGHLASMLAREIGMDETFCVQIEHAARLHDIGKIAVNEVILLKPGPLDTAEMAAMRLHTEVGAQILAGSSDPTLQMAVEVARHHHEWWNGNGYPRRLAQRDIPISARISAFADVYDALTHVRSYKAAWTHERALDEIVRLAGVQFDPDLVDPFRRVLDRYLADLRDGMIPGFADMDSNSLIASRKKLMETITASD